MANDKEIELRLAIGKHDDMLRRVSTMLDEGKRTGEIPRHLQLAQEELQALDEFLAAVAEKVTSIPEIPDRMWIAPVRFAYRTGYMKAGEWTWLESFHRGLQQSRAFFSALQPHPHADGTVTYSIGNAGVVVLGDNAIVSDVSVTQDFSTHISQIDLGQLADELARLRTAMRSKALSAEDDVAVGAVADAEVAARAGDRNRALEKLKAAGRWALDVSTQIGVEVAASAIKVQLGLPL